MSQANQRLTDLESAVARVLACWPDQPVPLQDMCEAMDNLAHIYNRNRGRPSKADLADAIKQKKREGMTQQQIADELGCSRVTVRKYLTSGQ